jgi:hypothetical protein
VANWGGDFDRWLASAVPGAARTQGVPTYVSALRCWADWAGRPQKCRTDGVAMGARRLRPVAPFHCERCMERGARAPPINLSAWIASSCSSSGKTTTLADSFECSALARHHIDARTAAERFASRRQPSHTTGHTGPVPGGSTELGLFGRIDLGKSERLEIVVA